MQVTLDISLFNWMSHSRPTYATVQFIYLPRVSALWLKLDTSQTEQPRHPSGPLATSPSFSSKLSILLTLHNSARHAATGVDPVLLTIAIENIDVTEVQ